MTIEDQNEETPETDEAVLDQATEELARVHARIGTHFRRAEARQRACGFLQGLLAPVERKNGWQLAEELGERGPRGVQRLLGEADWDEEAVRDDLRAYVTEHLSGEDGVLVVDETGFVKKGKKSAGVARQYSGTAGRRENSQVGVFLAYASHKGAAFIDRALYLPEEWTVDRVRCREAGIGDEVQFSTKGELARPILGRAFGPRVYEWAWLQLPEQSEGSGRARWILIRRSLSDASKRSYYRAAGPAQTSLVELVRVAGSRWKIEEGFEEAKGEVGLDQYEVRGFRAWYRHVTLALLAHAILVVLRADARDKKGAASRGASD